MNKFILYLPILTFLISGQGLSQSQINFNHLSVEDGLSQSSVTCILQDKKGFMWFGTQDGLNKFDGYSFKVFKNDPADSTSLTDNFIFSLYENSTGEFYIETQSGAFHLYNPLYESFMSVNKDSVDLTEARVSTVAARFYEASGVIWSGGLGSGTGLNRTDTKSGKTTIFKHNPRDPSSLSDDKVYSIYRDSSGNLWIGTYSGLDRFDEKSGKFIHYRHDPENPNSLPDNWVWPIYEDSRGHLWIGTVKGGLSRYDRKSNKFTNFENKPNNPTSINNNFIFSIYEDYGSVMWIGTDLGGINYFHPSANAFEHYKNNPDSKNSLNNNLVSSMLVDREGIYWIGTSRGGLNRFDYQNKSFTNFTHDPKKSNTLISNSVQSLMEDNSGILWIGTFNSGLDAYNQKTGVFTHFTHNPSDPNSLSDNRIYALAEDKNENIWIGTYGGGLNKLNKKTGQIFRYQQTVNGSTGLSSNATWSLAFDDSQNLWIGTFGGGVNVFDIDKNTFRQFQHNSDDSTSIIDNNIIRVFIDSKNRKWFGTTKGLSRYLSESGTFKNYTENDGLSNSFIYGIVEDNKGNIWLSTNNGLSKFNPQKEIFRNYFGKDGLQGNEFNQNAYAKDGKTGNILFGGPNGFNIFHPDNLKENDYVPPVEFTAYMRFNTDDEEGKPIFEKGISERKHIKLSHKDNIITFQFAALNFFNHQDNQYKYKLDGFNDNWIQLGNDHTVTFTNLSAGDYLLRVVGSNNDGIWNNEGTSLEISVSPPWWKTKIAYFLYIVIFFGFLYGIRRYEINRREQKAQIRESALRIKATEAENKALEIENQRKTKELEEARQLQLSMLPKQLPKLPNLEIAAFMRTATEVGGDYYDFYVEENGALNIAFGDATGHGMQAGTMVTLMKGFFTSDSSRLGLQEFMTHCSNSIKDIELGRILMSFSYLKIKNKRLYMTSAGMPPIYLHRKESNQLQEILVQGMPLGAMRDSKYQVTEKELNSGDTLVLLTDGLPELMNQSDEMFDYSRIKDSLNECINNSAEVIIKKLVEAGDHWMEGRAQDDDISFVVIRIK